DSVMFCLSKGLSAPVGSMLAGTRAFVERARRMRKMLGGGMRQAGVLAAAGICALTENVERLAEDHANALELARGLQGLPAIAVDLGRVETNMGYAHCLPPLTRARVVALCVERGITADASEVDRRAGRAGITPAPGVSRPARSQLDRPAASIGRAAASGGRQHRQRHAGCRPCPAPGRCGCRGTARHPEWCWLRQV